MLDKLTITISKTADRLSTYMQIASPGALPVNIVLIAEEIEVHDARDEEPAPKREGPELYDVPPNSTAVKCKSCGARMVWGKTRAGKAVPLSIDSPFAHGDGVSHRAPSHFTDCPQASSHSKKKT